MANERQVQNVPSQYSTGGPVAKFDCNGINVMLASFIPTDHVRYNSAADGRRTIVGNALCGEDEGKKTGQGKHRGGGGTGVNRP